MKKRFLSVFLVLAVFFFGTARIPASVFSYAINGATPFTIPDNNASGVTRTFSVSGIPADASIVRVWLDLNIPSHTWVGDLRGTLTSPDAETHTLFYDIGDTNSPVNTGDSSNLAGTYRFIDTAATTLWTAAEGGTSTFNIPAASYRTTNINVNAATSLNGTFGYPGLPIADVLFGKEKNDDPPTADVTNGTWTFVISDNATGDTGTVGDGTRLFIEFNSPTSANASIEGRLVTANGNGIRNATVVVRDATTSTIWTATSTSFGYFRFDELLVGRTYLVEVESRRFQFPAQIVRLDDSVSDLVIQAAAEY